MISDKVRPHHLERKAFLYVRQSSAHQVLHNRESSALQYAMRDRLTALGWSEIEVIDEDLGRSAAGGVQRAGFERMVAEVCLGKVGAVCAREVSRFARNSRDWQQLIEMCRVVDTVLVDQETVYAPRHGNMEYSALLRRTGHESELARLGALKKQRLALMSRIAELRRPQAAEALPATRHPREPAVAKLSQTLSAPMLRARAMAATVQRYCAGWLGGSQAPSGATALPSSE